MLTQIREIPMPPWNLGTWNRSATALMGGGATRALATLPAENLLCSLMWEESGIHRETPPVQPRDQCHPLTLGIEPRLRRWEARALTTGQVEHLANVIRSFSSWQLWPSHFLLLGILALSRSLLTNKRARIVILRSGSSHIDCYTWQQLFPLYLNQSMRAVKEYILSSIY